MKKVVKILSISLIAIMMMSTLCFADGVDELFTVTPEALDMQDSKLNATKVLGYIQWIGIAIAIGMMIFLGIKYMTKGVSEQAEIKKSLPIYVLGIVLIVAAPMIVKAILKAAGNE